MSLINLVVLNYLESIYQPDEHQIEIENKLLNSTVHFKIDEDRKYKTHNCKLSQENSRKHKIITEKYGTSLGEDFGTTMHINKKKKNVKKYCN